MALASEPRPHLFSRDEWRLANETGLFRDIRVELLCGEVVELSPLGARHQDAVDRFTLLFVQGLDSRRWRVRVQGPIALNDRTEPEPDLAVLRAAGDYTADHPGPADVALVIEVADTSWRYDRDRKLPLYAHAAIPEVWLVDLNRRRIEIHRRPDPEAGVYLEALVALPGSTVTALGELELAVDAVIV
ncbi:MAG: Uma2 family endonuclease [Acidimicrobiales bacterium]